MTALANLGSLWNSIQAWLFPMLEDELGELDEKHREFVAVCELCAPQAYVGPTVGWAMDCPPASHLAYRTNIHQHLNLCSLTPIFAG